MCLIRTNSLATDGRMWRFSLANETKGNLTCQTFHLHCQTRQASI
jgi:hypothetical protein